MLLAMVVRQQKVPSDPQRSRWVKMRRAPLALLILPWLASPADAHSYPMPGMIGIAYLLYLLPVFAVALIGTGAIARRPLTGTAMALPFVSVALAFWFAAPYHHGDYVTHFSFASLSCLAAVFLASLWRRGAAMPLLVVAWAGEAITGLSLACVLWAEETIGYPHLFSLGGALSAAGGVAAGVAMAMLAKKAENRGRKVRA